MTNKEKFKEIFGIEPDCGRCNPYPCEENDCKYWEQCEDQPGCACDDWWDWEFEEPTTKNDLGVDCISRADVFQVLWNYEDIHNPNYDLIIKDIRALPSVTPQEPRWIPVSERLPKENVDVLVVVEFPDGKDGTLQRIEIASFGLMHPLGSEKGWITNNFARIAKTEVMAWMPLPEPYREVEK